MTFRHLKIFLTVCETMNMTKAAGELHISQPSITQAIHELEDHYGILLFKRTGLFTRVSRFRGGIAGRGENGIDSRCGNESDAEK